mmetsp:Transcript_44438/g.142448  ORF Transcript_44438/g.142448 Transcript_44438/m.142448 type:complete len:618 (-) Transcript_44438:262-2115(-)
MDGMSNAAPQSGATQSGATQSNDPSHAGQLPSGPGVPAQQPLGSSASAQTLPHGTPPSRGHTPSQRGLLDALSGLPPHLPGPARSDSAPSLGSLHPAAPPLGIGASGGTQIPPSTRALSEFDVRSLSHLGHLDAQVCASALSRPVRTLLSDVFLPVGGQGGGGGGRLQAGTAHSLQPTLTSVSLRSDDSISDGGETCQYSARIPHHLSGAGMGTWPTSPSPPPSLLPTPPVQTVAVAMSARRPPPSVPMLGSTLIPQGAGSGGAVAAASLMPPFHGAPVLTSPTPSFSPMPRPMTRETRRSHGDALLGSMVTQLDAGCQSPGSRAGIDSPHRASLHSGVYTRSPSTARGSSPTSPVGALGSPKLGSIFEALLRPAPWSPPHSAAGSPGRAAVGSPQSFGGFGELPPPAPPMAATPAGNTVFVGSPETAATPFALEADVPLVPKLMNPARGDGNWPGRRPDASAGPTLLPPHKQVATKERHHGVPMHLPDDPRLDAMELAFAQQREQQLDCRLSELERLADQIAAAGDGGGGGDAAASAWQPGGRDFQQVFMAGKLGGFYIDRTKVPTRETYLTAVAHQHVDHQVIDFMAGRTAARSTARQRLIEQRAWRGLDQFDED